MGAPWSSDANVIAFNLTSADADALRRSAGNRFLAVELGNSPRHNNADVLVLAGTSSLALAYVRNFRHAQWVAVPVRPNAWGLLGWVAALVQCLLGVLHWPRLVRLDAAPRAARLLAFRVRWPHHQPRVRNYIPHRLGVPGFFDLLRAGGHRHVVLRWFESLPAIAPGEDLDMLVDDAALPAVRALLTAGPGLQPLDLYSVTGLPGADYRSMPYFPPYLAAGVLDRAVTYNGLCGVPSPRDHLLTLAYHAIYHKGANCGLPSENAEVASGQSPDHDYADVLARLACAVDVAPPKSLEEIDRLLDAAGWRPSHDMLARLAQHNPWLRARLGDASADDADHGLAVFLLRELALQRGGVEKAHALLERHGFSIVRTMLLAPEESRTAAASIRGGNWGPGPWPVSGGPPAAVIVAYDMDPLAPTRRQKKGFPFLANARLLTKNDVRDQFNAGLPKDEHANVIHSSDNGREALDYLRIIMPREVEPIAAAVASLKQAYDTEAPVLATRTKSGRRAKVEVVRHEGRLAVRKTFKAHQLRFCRREESALRELSAAVAEVPPVLAGGESWLIIPYYDDVLRYKRSSGMLLPLPVARQAIAALRRVYEAGYAIVDASIDNLLVDRREGLKLFDFEFCHRYEHKPSRFEDSYDIAGCPADFSGDQPIQGGNSYDRNWRPYIGLSLDSLLQDPAWLQHFKRGVYFAAHFYRFVPRLVRHALRPASRPSLPVEADAPPAPAPRRAA